jgi:hypothetical protein
MMAGCVCSMIRKKLSCIREVFNRKNPDEHGGTIDTSAGAGETAGTCAGRMIGIWATVQALPGF